MAEPLLEEDKSAGKRRRSEEASPVPAREEKRQRVSQALSRTSFVCEQFSGLPYARAVSSAYTWALHLQLTAVVYV